MATTLFDVASARARFSSLQDGGFVFLDAPGGSQVPDEVGDAIARTLREASANNGAPYATSKRVEAIYNQARVDAGRFLNCSPDDVIFGANMTTLDFMLTRTAARDWRVGDKILVSRLDHDGGVAPWVELAADRGFDVDWVDVTPDLRLDLDDLERKLDDRVRVVACVAASNAVGTITDIPRVAELAHAAGALCWVDARPLRRARADRRRGARLRRPPLLAVQVLRPASRPRVRPARAAGVVAPVQGAAGADDPLGHRFETGTPPYELLAGFSATIAYLESLGGMGVAPRLRAHARPALLRRRCPIR